MNPLMRVLVAAVGVLGLPSLVWAAPPASDASSNIAQALGAPVSAQALAEHRGGHFYQIGKAQLTAQMQDNQALGNVTGRNIVTQQAFYGASGVPTVIQNSGNNVVIQNATILNVQMQ